MNEVAIYQFKSNPVRIIKDGKGEPWFVAKDICGVLGFTNTTMALRKLPKDGLNRIEVIDAMGRRQLVNAINEPGLYQLIMRSDKPQAKEFQGWVTREVLPTIRKTGSYSVQPISTLEQAMTSLAQTMASLATTTASHGARLTALEEKQPQSVPRQLPQTTLSLRAQFNMAERELAKALGIPHKDCYGQTYKTLYYAKGIDLKARAKNSGLKPIDVAEQMGCLSDLLTICNEMYATGRK